jgi:hypothetical protein
VTRLRAVRPGFVPRRGQEIFLFYIASRPALGPTQLHIQWVLGALSPGIKRQRRQADHPYLVPRSRIVKLYLHSAICVHGTVLNCIIKYRDNFTFFLPSTRSRMLPLHYPAQATRDEWGSSRCGALHVALGTIKQLFRTACRSAPKKRKVVCLCWTRSIDFVMQIYLEKIRVIQFVRNYLLVWNQKFQ